MVSKLSKKLTNEYLSIFCTEMAIIYQSGFPLADGVMMLLDDADKSGRLVLSKVLEGLQDGLPLSGALEKTGFFPAYLIGMVEVGEAAGRPAETLVALAAYYDRMDRMAVSAKNAVFFPLILLAMMVAVVLILIIQVLPIFDDVFGRLGARLSPLAAALMDIGQWLGDGAIVIAIVFGALFVFVMLLWLFPGLRDSLFSAIKNRWGGHGIFGDAASAHFVSSMALSMASGLNTEDSLKMSASISGGARTIDERNAQCITSVRDGSTLAEAMGEAKILTQREMRMLALGLKGGMGDSTMADIARKKERYLQDRINRLINRVEPTLVIAASVIVGVILLSVMLPLVGIMASIG
jgi:type IV pilus assembly protein PilC